MKENWNQQLLDLINASPSCYHVTENLVELLQQAGYCRLREEEAWKLAVGGKYFVVRGDSTLAAFRIPEENFRGFMLAAAHSDFPTMKLRQEPETASPGGCVRLSVEGYGGGIWRSWLDRPLSAAGRVMVEENGRLVMRLVNIDRDLLVIPSVAIHLDREVNKGTELKMNVDMLPLFAAGQETDGFRKLVAEAAGVDVEKLVSMELFLYPREKGSLLGQDDAFISAPRLDDLQCVFGCLRGFLDAQDSAGVPVLCIFNNEEVGSGTRQGADSTFLTDVVDRICHAMNLDVQQAHMARAQSFLVSADNAHGVHPAHPEYADKVDAPVLGGGVVIKYNANQRYTTDAVSAAVFKKICAQAGVPVQRYSNRADLPGGSTLGNISTAHLSVPTVDIGLAQLAMHSCRELASARDTEALVKAMTAYFGCRVQRLADGTISI